MWHALRAELAYFRPWLLGALGIAVAVSTLVSVLIQIDGDAPDFATVGIRSMFLIMAPMIVGFIVLALFMPLVSLIESVSSGG